MEALAEADPAKLRAELVHVAAVCAAWVSDIDTRPTAARQPAERGPKGLKTAEDDSASTAEQTAQAAAEFDAGTALLVGEQVTAYAAAIYAAALNAGADAIAALPQDYECDPGRGDAVKLLRRLAADSTPAAVQGPKGLKTETEARPAELTQAETDITHMRTELDAARRMLDPGDCALVDEMLSTVDQYRTRAKRAETALERVEPLAPMFEALHALLVTSSRDWGEYRVDAWLWAVLVGWGCNRQHEHDETCDADAAMTEMQQRHGWSDEAVAKARRYRAAVRAVLDGGPNVGSAPDHYRQQAHLDAALSVIDQVRQLHHQDGSLCGECTESHGVLWPCTTIQTLDALDALTNDRALYAKKVEAAIGLNADCGGALGVYAARDAVLAVRDQELEELRARATHKEAQ
ncbi:hypothetical protein [Streptomyces sp. NPDC001750]|uniref:hypothetical protein n=1 Tax=Streptomyces sp. NPDC001750 TaxID=3364607 RepID=UPI0036CD8426